MFRISRFMDEIASPTLILSGGEPLLRPDIFEIGKREESGLLHGPFLERDAHRTVAAECAAETGFDYVGISLNGLDDTHDAFRRRPGAFKESLRGIRLCRDAGSGWACASR